MSSMLTYTSLSGQSEAWGERNLIQHTSLSDY